MNYALIKNNVIDNIIVADHCNANLIANSIGAIAVNVELLPVAIGDTYTDGVFTRKGIIIDRPLTDAEQINLLGQQNTDLDLANIELGQQNTDLELRILELEAKVNV